MNSHTLASRVASDVTSRQDRFAAGCHHARAELAQLRTMAGGHPSGQRLIDAVTQPGDNETVTWATLTLHAIHSQGTKPTLAHQTGISIGAAYAQLWLCTDDSQRTATERRFTRLLATPTIHEVLPHLRQTVALLRDNGIGLDYGQLADHLTLIHQPLLRHRARSVWGRDFYRIVNQHSVTGAAA